MAHPRDGKNERNPTIAYRVLVGIIGIFHLGSGILWMIVCDPFFSPLEAVR